LFGLIEAQMIPAHTTLAFVLKKISHTIPILLVILMKKTLNTKQLASNCRSFFAKTTSLHACLLLCCIAERFYNKNVATILSRHGPFR
jgi:hypothetical protein